MRRLFFLLIPTILLIPLACLSEDEFPRTPKEFDRFIIEESVPKSPEETVPKSSNQPEQEVKSNQDLNQFYSDLSELLDINNEIAEVMYSYPMQPLSKKDMDTVKDKLKSMLEKVVAMEEWYQKNSPVLLTGFAINIPFGVTVNFEIISENL